MNSNTDNDKVVQKANDLDLDDKLDEKFENNNSKCLESNYVLGNWFFSFVNERIISISTKKDLEFSDLYGQNYENTYDGCYEQFNEFKKMTLEKFPDTEINKIIFSFLHKGWLKGATFSTLGSLAQICLNLPPNYILMYGIPTVLLPFSGIIFVFFSIFAVHWVSYSSYRIL